MNNTQIKVIPCALACLMFAFLYATKASAASEQARETYKCYLETSWTPQIGYFEWLPANTKKHIANLPGTKLPATPMSQNRKAYIKRAIECVPIDKGFSNAKARKLESELADFS